MNFDVMVESFQKLSEDEKRKAINELARTVTIHARECGFLGENDSLTGIEEASNPERTLDAAEIEAG